MIISSKVARLEFLQRVACLLLLVATLPAFARDRLDTIRDAGVLRVGTTGDYKPFSYRDPSNGWLSGSDVEMARSLSVAIGVRLEFVPTTWSSLLRDATQDRFDIAMGGISVTAQRAAQAAFSVPYLQDGKTPVTRCENTARFATLVQIDRPGVRLIVNPGGTNEAFARSHFSRAAIRVFEDNVGIFDELVAGRADVMVTDAVEARLQQQLRPDLCAVHPDEPFDSVAKAYLLPRDAAFKTFVDTWLGQVQRSVRGGATLQRWLDHPWAANAAAGHAQRAELLQLIDARLALMPEVARYKWNTGGAIEDLPRERDVLAAQGREAVALGLEPRWAEQFLRAQIEASKQMQRELFAQWRQRNVARFANVQDLTRDIRPQLDGITARLLRALAAYDRSLPAPRGSVVRRDLGALSSEGVSAAAVEIALAPLLEPAQPVGEVAARPQ